MLLLVHSGVDNASQVPNSVFNIRNKQSTTPHTDCYDNLDEIQVDDPDLTFVPDPEEI